jgi:hypothetical protein
MREPTFLVDSSYLHDKISVELNIDGGVDFFNTFYTGLKLGDIKCDQFVTFLNTLENITKIDIFAENCIENVTMFAAACHYYFGY